MRAVLLLSVVAMVASTVVSAVQRKEQQGDPSAEGNTVQVVDAETLSIVERAAIATQLLLTPFGPDPLHAYKPDVVCGNLQRFTPVAPIAVVQQHPDGIWAATYYQGLGVYAGVDVDVWCSGRPNRWRDNLYIATPLPVDDVPYDRRFLTSAVVEPSR